MEFFKEIYDAWGARVKSRVFGSIIVAFTLINWKVLFFLAFDDAKTTEKFTYFDTYTNVFTLYIWPIFLGGFIGLVLPFVNNWTHWFVSKPVSAMRSRDDEYAHERLKKKNEWLVERNRAQELLERQIIDEAKRDEEVAEIADPVRRAEVEEEIGRSRSIEQLKPAVLSEVNLNNAELDESLLEIAPLQAIAISEDAENLLRKIATGPSGRFRLLESQGKYSLHFSDGTTMLSGRKRFLELLQAVVELRKYGLLEADENVISKRGYDYMDLRDHRN